jgi:hypothetical protein
LGVQPGEPAIKLEAVPGIEASGPSLAYLISSDHHGERFWDVRNHWIRLERDFTLVYVAAQMLHFLWQIARVRYLGWPFPRGGIPMGPAVSLSELLNASQTKVQHETGVEVDQVTMPPEMFAPPGSGADALLEELETASDTSSNESAQ